MIAIAGLFIGLGLAVGGFFIAWGLEIFGKVVAEEISRPINIIHKQEPPDAD